MSIEAVAQFREAVNANEDWQEEIRNFGEEGNMVDFANGKGHAFTSEEYNEYVGSNVEGELSEFEMELVAGGGSTMGAMVQHDMDRQAAFLNIDRGPRQSRQT